MNNFQRLFDLIDKHGLTAKAVAEETGISTGNITDWKVGRCAPTGKKITQLADYFGCTADYLLERTDTPRCVHLPDNLIDKITAGDRRFVDLNKILHKPKRRKAFCFIRHKDRGKIKKIYFLARAYDGSLISEKEFCALFEFHSDIAADEYGILLSPKNYLTFRKIYDIYLESYINAKITEMFD